MMELPLQLVVLGKGDQKYEEFFHWASQQYPGRMAVRLDYNEELSMAIYAGAALFLNTDGAAIQNLTVIGSAAASCCAAPTMAGSMPNSPGTPAALWAC